MPNREPLRIFEGTQRPHEPFWRVRNAEESDSGEPEMEFYGWISEYSWFGDEITPKMFKDDLERIGAGGPVTIRINSGGGDVFAASVIRSIIMDYPGFVTTRIDGLCASAATFVALAGDRVKMQDTAYFMIHDPSALVWGTIEDLKSMLELLKTIKGGIMDSYQTKTGLELEKLSKMMTDETWLTAKEAKRMKFVDEVISSKKSPAPADVLNRAAIVNALTQFANVPAALLAPATAPEEPVDPAAERLRAEVKLFL